MADSVGFEHSCRQLEAETDLTRLEARGTIRLALKQAGFSASSVSSAQLPVVVTEVLGQELQERNVAEPERVVERLAAALRALPDSTSGETPEAVFARLGGDS